MADYTKITNEDLVGHKIEELADTPAMTTAALKKRFDSLSVDVIIPKFNQLVDEISSLDGNVEAEFVATKAYVNTQDATNLTTAKAYTDSEITSATTTIESYADTKDATTLASAKSYADTQDATTLASAKSYADTKDASTLATAKSYADSEDATTLASAKSYADSKDATTLVSAMAHADLVANNAYNSAKAYTNATAVKSVSVNALYDAGNKIATINVDGTETEVYAPSGGSGGTSDYSELVNKPSINGTTLSGNKTASQLGFATVATSGSYNDLSNKPSLKTVATSGLAKDITTDAGESLQKTLDELASFESITYKGTVANYASLPSNASNGDMYYVTADAKHYVCVKDDEISLYEWHDYHSFDDGYMVTVEKVKNDTTTTDSGYVLDARVGKTLADTDANIMGGDAYDATHNYSKGNCCVYNNAVYMALQDDVVGVVPTNTTYWKKVTLASLNNRLNSGVFYCYDMTAETVATLNNSNDWQTVTAPYDGYYQAVVITLSPTVAVGTNCAIGCVKNGSNKLIWGNQTPSVKANVQNMSPYLYFKQGDTIRVTTAASVTSGTQVFRLDCWH